MGQSGTNQPKQRRFQSLFFFFAASLDLHSSSIFLFLSLLPRKSPLPLLFHQSFLFLFFPSLPCEEEPQSAKKEREYSGSLFLLLPLLFPLPTTKRGAPPPSSSPFLDGSPLFHFHSTRVREGPFLWAALVVVIPDNRSGRGEGETAAYPSLSLKLSSSSVLLRRMFLGGGRA